MTQPTAQTTATKFKTLIDNPKHAVAFFGVGCAVAVLLVTLYLPLTFVSTDQYPWGDMTVFAGLSAFSFFFYTSLIWLIILGITHGIKKISGRVH